ncbi:MAG: PAS domain-containing protein [Microcoleus sp. SIO2G3]|nr:PAS domain-containing protein [Microcoleus sp. SIO2G3]
MEITPVALWIAHDPNCHTMSANQTAYDLMQATPGSVPTATPTDGSYPLQFKHHRNGQEVALHDLPMQRAARTGQEIIDELEFVFEDGTVRFIYGKAIPLCNETGSVRGAIGAFVDVTQRKHEVDGWKSA